MNTKVLGIDLGTTNCCVAIIEGNKKTKIIENNEGKRTTPSVVSFGTDGTVSIGDIAKRQACTNSLKTIFAFKRLIGKKYSDIKQFANKLSYKVVADKNGNAVVEIDGKIMSPVEISAKLLMKLVETASTHTGQTIKGTKVVITVPAHFDNLQREATKSAGEIAGLDVVRIINEPTAAAMAYGLDSSISGNILVYDLGGGTFDVTIINIDSGVCQVVATDGDSELGGEDFDLLLTEHILSKFDRIHPNNNVKNDKAAIYRIRDAAKQAKENLSSCEMTNISVPYIAPGPLNLDVQVSRKEFETLISKLVKQTIDTVVKTCKDAKLENNQIKAIVLVGGSTRIPLVKQSLIQIFGSQKIKQDINADEVVAEGAALQGGIISGDFKDVVLIDVTSLTLGIESFGGIMASIVEKSTAIPLQKSKVFTTAADNQTEAQIAVYQGERKFVNDCRKLGQFVLSGIKPAPKGIPQIEVTFEIDANGLLIVSAMDLATKTKQEVSLQPEVGITNEEKEKMKKEAEEQHDADVQKEKLVLAKHELESVLYTLNAEEKKTVENKVENKITEELKKKISDFKEESNKILSEKSINDAKIYSDQTNKGYEIVKEIMNLNTPTKTNDQTNTNNTDTKNEAKPEDTEEQPK